ncbi:MAG TPA: hypothetical protein VFM21_10820, partial [Terriglobia bacterium]|nr:hypothetical protein [Terriglobia bacterium]
MKPFTVIKVAGPVMLIGGVLFIYFTVWTPLIATLRRDTILSGHHLHVAFFVTHVAPDLALAAWMMATAIGILRFRAWARISILVLSFHAIYFAAGLLVVVRMVVSNPPAGEPWAPVIWYLLPLGIAGIAGVWVVQFADEGMDGIFLPPRATCAATMPPLSLSVIAGWLLVLWPIRLYQLLLTPRASGPLFPAFPIG